MASTLRVTNFSAEEAMELHDELKEVERPMGYLSATVSLNMPSKSDTDYPYNSAPTYSDQTIISLYNTLSAMVQSTATSPSSHPNAASPAYERHSEYHDEYAQYISSLQAELEADTSSDDEDDEGDIAYPYTFDLNDPRLIALARSREERHRARFTHSLDRCYAWRLSTIDESISRSSLCEVAEEMCDDRAASGASDSSTTVNVLSDGTLSVEEHGNDQYPNCTASNNSTGKGFWKLVMSMSTRSEVSLLDSLGSKSQPSLHLDPQSIEKCASTGSHDSEESTNSAAKRKSKRLRCLVEVLKDLVGKNQC